MRMSDRAVEAAYVRMPGTSIRQQTESGGDSRTDKSAAAGQDVNNIINQYARHGSLPTENAALAQFADVSELQGELTERLQWARNQVENAKEMLRDEQERQRQEAQRIQESVQSAGDRDSARETVLEESREGIDNTGAT